MRSSAKQRWVSLRALAIATALSIGPMGCGATTTQPVVTTAAAARKAGPASSDSEVVGRWLLSELIAPGGSAERATQARERLEKLGHTGLFSSLAVAIDEEVHGHPSTAATAYLDTVRAARSSPDPLASVAGWYAANHLVQLTSSAPDLWQKAKPVVEHILSDPGALGWRARAEVVELWLRGASEEGQQDLQERSVGLYGCHREARIAGPFGHSSRADRYRAFDAEKPGPWPATWPTDGARNEPPRVIKTERSGCTIRADEAISGGVFYAETFIEVEREQPLLIAVQGALNIWIDDTLVLTRDLREWGVWPRFGVQVKLSPGRHRIVAKLGEPETSIRVLNPDGSPAQVKAVQAAASYSSSAPSEVSDPNVVDRYIRKGAVVPPKDEIEAFLAAHLAAVEGQFDVANVLMEPLIAKHEEASGLALSTTALLVEKDPIFPPQDAHDLAHLLNEKAAQRDPKLYGARLSLLVDEAEKGEGKMAEGVRGLRALDQEFAQVPDVLRVLTAIYSRLGWKPEKSQTILELAKRFPGDRNAQEAALDVLEETGRLSEADELRAKIKKQFPDSEVELARAIRRRDHVAAIAELKRLQQRRPDRKDIAERISALLSNAGEKTDVLPLMERALARDPKNPRARLGLADAKFARGDESALRSSLATAIQLGANTDELRAAIEIVEGMTELEPYRMDGKKVIDEFNKTGKQLEGTAARILDYSVLWIHADGTARMLEHEIVKIQSPEAINKLAEQRPPNNAMVLRLRVHKPNGRTLEPERVEGKPTLTMPHLEVGDVIETEYVFPTENDGEGGLRYLSPTWFFREEDIAYWRSEFAVIAPRSKAIVLEPRGSVPEPKIRDDAGHRVWYWRVDESPAAVVEVGAPSIREFLPSVRVGWGVSLDDQLRRMKDGISHELPTDPRLLKVAEKIVQNVNVDQVEERARRVYRWVLENVADGNEGDGRRVIIGKKGSRAAAFLYLARALKLPVEIAAVQDRLQPVDAGPIASALAFDNMVLRLGKRSNENTSPLYFTVGDKHAPFGYLPAELRDQPAVRLIDGLPKEKTTAAREAFDGIVYDANLSLRKDGSGMLQLEQRFVGKMAIQMRNVLEQLPDANLKPFVESRILARALPSGRLAKLSVEDRDSLDKPLTLKMEIEVSAMARKRGDTLTFHTPFMMLIGSVATSETRQSPLLLGESTHSEVHLTISLPDGATLTTTLDKGVLRDEERSYSVADEASPGKLIINRTLDIPAGRVSVHQYAGFRIFALGVDSSTMREFTVRLGSP